MEVSPMKSLGEKAPATKREAVEKLAMKAGFEAMPILQLMDIREGRLDRKTVNVDDLCARYLKAVERITAAVDEMLD